MVARRRRGAGPRRLDDPNKSLERIRANQTPKDWSEARKTEAYRRGHICSQCRHFIDKERAREELKRDQFWERAFKYHGDGTDLSPRHLGNPEEYSICEKKGCAVHELAPWCEHGEN